MVRFNSIDFPHVPYLNLDHNLVPKLALKLAVSGRKNFWAMVGKAGNFIVKADQTISNAKIRAPIGEIGTPLKKKRSYYEKNAYPIYLHHNF